MAGSDASLTPINELASAQVPDPDDVRNVLGYPAFRRLWIALSLSSLGDWLGLLATTAIAADLTKKAGGREAAAESAFAIGGVLIFRLMPAVVFGPFAGVFADRFDRRKTMVVCDLLRFGLFVSIPLVRTVPYLLFASFVVESISLFWIPAKEASVPNLLPAAKLEAANQLSLITTYGSAPVAAAIFTGLATVSVLLGKVVPFFEARPTDLALYFDGATFLFSAFTVARLGGLGHGQRQAAAEQQEEGFLSSITTGWKFIGGTPLVRGLVIGILGAFASGGAVIALGRVYVDSLNGGNAAWGLLFGAVFSGLAIGMGLGPRLLGDFSRRRLFGLSIVGAGASLAVIALLPDLELVLVAALAVGAFSGVAWVTGYTLLGAQVEDHLRGRTFAAVQSLVRVALLLTLATAPLLAGGIQKVFDVDGVTAVLLLAGVLAALVGVVSYRQMSEPGQVSLLRALVPHLPIVGRRRPRFPGVLIALEGGEGAGKSTQARRLGEWLESHGHEVVVTFEPGATDAGTAIRRILLDPATRSLSPRAEALLYAADRADHVASVIRPALDRGAVVITDRYTDSSVSYQGAGRELPAGELVRISEWATGGVLPHLTVLLDLDPAIGLARAGGDDRMERESPEFHRRVRAGFRERAAKGGDRYAVIDATRSADAVHQEIRAAVERRLASRLADLLAAGPAPIGAHR